MNTTLALYADYGLYSAMAVLTLAMIGYTVYLAGLVPSRQEARVADLVVAGPAGAEALPAGAEALPAAAGALPADALPADALPADAEAAVPRRARKAAGVAGSLTNLGALLLVATVVLRGIAAQRPPLGNMYEFAVMGCMFTVVAFAVWSTRRDLRWLGVFVVGPVVLTLGLAATVWYTEAADLMPSLRSIWLVIHVIVATLSIAIFTIAFSVTVTYLVQQRVEAEKRVSFMNRLPDSRTLEKLSYQLHIVAFPLWTFTLIAGAIWARQAWGSYWNWDPKEVWTFVIWVVYAAYLHARATSGWSRTSAASIAVAGFACIIVNYAVVNVFFVGQHSYSGL